MSDSTTLQPTEIAAVRRKASGSSFYAAMRLMPKEARNGMFAIYAFCRAVDDIADDGLGSREDRRTKLEAWRSDLAELYAGGSGGRTSFLKPVVVRYAPRLEDFLAVIDGMEMDVAQDIVAPDLGTLDLYCDRVASAVGRLSIKVFGMEEGPGFALAHHLGRALQMTNILRDLDEDGRIHRLYLPRDYLLEAGVTIGEPLEALADPKVDIACKRLAALAHGHYEKAARVMDSHPAGNLRPPRLMGAVYEEILRRTEEIGWAAPRTRVHLPKLTMLKIVLQSGLKA